MAIATRTLKDTIVDQAAAGGKVTVLITFDDSTASNTNVVDASGLDGHANGALLDITRLWWAINNGKDDDDKNWAFLEFVGASSDTLAINLAGTGYYDGTAGPITNNATLANNYLTRADERLREARFIDATENSLDTVEANEFTDARL